MDNILKDVVLRKVSNADDNRGNSHTHWGRFFSVGKWGKLPTA